MLQRNDALGYHVLPPKGLLNDPNGLIFFKGLYHVFFQWNPFDTDHSQKYWGHATSKDLIRFTYHTAALSPEDWYDKNGCYSGSAIEKDGKLYLFYTGNVKSADGVRTSYQCAAVSEDGMHFKKIGPVTAFPKGYTAHVRDPKVFQDKKNGYWMLLGAQRDDLTGDAILYHSNDLMEWSFKGSLMEKEEHMGYMWECPDLIQFSEGDVLLLSPQGLEKEGDRFHNIFQTGYYTGLFHEGRFERNRLEFDELDRGFEFYAPQSFFDFKGRQILFGWMGVMEPEREEAMPTREEGWMHHLSLPRELSLQEGRIVQKPIEELKSLRHHSKEQEGFKATITLEGSMNEVEVRWDKRADRFRMEIRKEVLIHYDDADRKLHVQRTDWLHGKSEVRRVQLKESLRYLQIFLEESTMEMFVNGGQEVFSLRYFANAKESEIHMEEMNLSQVFSLKLHTLKV